VKLDGNENPYGPSPRALAALSGGYPAHRYPDPDQRRLREALSRHLDVPAECIVAGAGADELIDLLFRAYIEPGDRVVIATPTFGMYAFDAELSDAKLVDVPRLDPDWRVDTRALAKAAAQAKVAFLPSPNNPTGQVLPAEACEALLGSGALLVLDEAYIEFAGRALDGGSRGGQRAGRRVADVQQVGGPRRAARRLRRDAARYRGDADAGEAALRRQPGRRGRRARLARGPRAAR
jgi:histidinol-phosphate aminotransferase